MNETIKIFRDAAENFRKQTTANGLEKKLEGVLSKLADISINIKELEEEYIPHGLVHGLTYKCLKDRIDGITKLLLWPPGKYLFEDLLSNHEKFINDISLVKARYTPERQALVQGRRLLSIDGGGVRGICSLLVLQGLMKAIQAVEKGEPLDLSGKWDEDEESNRNLPLPQKYFDLVGGTSTGGLIAIMLFRLGMPICTVQKKYYTLSKAIFNTRISRFLGSDFIKPLFNRPWFSGRKLENEVRKILTEKGERDEMIKDGVECRTFVCAVTKRTHHAVNFRTYYPPDLTHLIHIPCTITQAARATSAAPFYFPSKKIGKITFWDGGLQQNNNPICQVLGENSPAITTVVVSLGTGKPSQFAAPDSLSTAELEDLESPWFS